MKFLHAMVRVLDLDASMHFYCDLLGLKEIRRKESDKGRYTLIFLGAENSDERHSLLELTYNWDPENYGSGRNFGHLAYSVDNIYKTCEELMKKNPGMNVIVSVLRKGKEKDFQVQLTNKEGGVDLIKKS